MKHHFRNHWLAIVSIGILAIASCDGPGPPSPRAADSGPLPAASDSPEPYEIKEFAFDGREGQLAGRLFLPRSADRPPALLYVEGSDDGNTNASPYVRALARGFARRNIALFSFNKRGIAGSSGTPTDDFDERAGDVVSAYRFLAGIESIDGRKAGIYGISQAGWVIPRALDTLGNVPFIILVSPAGVTPAGQVTFYLRNAWREAGMKDGEVDQATDLHRLAAGYYRSGSERDYRAAIGAVERARGLRWFPLLNRAGYRVEVPDSGNIPTPEELSSAIADDPEEYAFYRSAQNWEEDPSLYRSIVSPVLVIYGGQDRMVPVEESMMVFQHSFARNRNGDVTFRIFEAAGHDIQRVGSPYLTDGYVEYIADWISGR